MAEGFEGEVKPPGGMERLLLSAARRIALVMAFIFFFGAIACVVLAILPRFYNPGLFFTAEIPTLEAFEQSQQGPEGDAPGPQVAPGEDPNVTSAVRDAEAARERELFERRLSGNVTKIYANLSAYASQMGQAQPDIEALRNMLRNDFGRFSAFAAQNELDTTSSPAWDYIEALAQQTAVLKGVAPELKKLAATDTRRVDWQRFVEWYRNAFERKLVADAQALQEQRGVSMMLKEGSNWLIGAAMALITFFLLFIILLVLLRIERNTRAIEQNTRA